MSKSLICLAHPNFRASRVNRTWIEAVRKQPNLAEILDISSFDPHDREQILHHQALLAAHSRVILQFPLYDFSYPAVLKSWIDNVLCWGWAFGLPDQPEQNHMASMKFGLAVCCGCTASDFSADGYIGYSLADCFISFRAFLNYAHSDWLGLHALFGAEANLSEDDLLHNTQAYLKFLENL